MSDRPPEDRPPRSAPERPLVSVIIPAYNAAPFVEIAIDSALAQTYPAVEVVVVDDGSTDDTARLIDAYGDRIVTIHKENGGIGTARNAAIAVSRGEFIALLDADDIWLPNRLARCIDRFEARPELGLVTTDAFLVDVSGAPHGGRYYDTMRWADGEHTREILRRNFIFIGVVLRRAVFDAQGLFDEGLRKGCEDYDMWMRSLAAGWSVDVVKEPLAKYRVHASSMSRRKQDMLDAERTALAKNLPAYWALGEPGPASRNLGVAWHLLSQDGPRRALPFLRASVRDAARQVSEPVRRVTNGARAR